MLGNRKRGREKLDRQQTGRQIRREREGMLGEQFLNAGCVCERETQIERGGKER
jgi:hypothetical protein